MDYVRTRNTNTFAGDLPVVVDLLKNGVDAEKFENGVLILSAVSQFKGEHFHYDFDLDIWIVEDEGCLFPRLVLSVFRGDGSFIIDHVIDGVKKLEDSYSICFDDANDHFELKQVLPK